jgi:hypothetical protein
MQNCKNKPIKCNKMKEFFSETRSGTPQSAGYDMAQALGAFAAKGPEPLRQRFSNGAQSKASNCENKATIVSRNKGFSRGAYHHSHPTVTLDVSQPSIRRAAHLLSLAREGTHKSLGRRLRQMEKQTH